MRNQRSQMMPSPTLRTLWGEGNAQSAILDILCRYYHPSFSPTDKETIAKLREENEQLKGKVKELEASQAALEARVAALNSAGSISSSAETEKETSVATASAQPSSEPAAPVEAPTDASETPAESKPAEEKPDSEGDKFFIGPRCPRGAIFGSVFLSVCQRFLKLY